MGLNLIVDFTIFSHLAMVGACHVNAWTGQFYGSVPDIDIVKEVIFDAIFQTL